MLVGSDGSTPAPYDAPVLSASDPLPQRPNRVAVAGVSGSGKSTLARRLATLLDLPYTEMDALFHGPGWTPRPTFRAEVEALVAGDRCVCEWQYDEARPLVAARADLLVWVDLPFRVALGRLVRRTVGRRVRREELWHGNREAPLHTFFTDPDHVVRWSVRSRHSYRDRIPAVAAEHPGLVVVRLRSAREVDRWLRDVLEPLA
jgi:adenylate kinase family enzyme